VPGGRWGQGQGGPRAAPRAPALRRRAAAARKDSARLSSPSASDDGDSRAGGDSVARLNEAYSTNVVIIILYRCLLLQK
jgi:hypothetical protein